VLLYGVMAGSAAAVAWLAATEGDGRELVEDLFLLGASIAAANSLTRGVQHATGRTRPYALGAEGPLGERDLRSFFSGHASLSFAAAAAATQVMRLRGRRGWEWIAAASFTAAAAAGWMRVAADQHWATDVLAGAGVGTAVGWAIPTFALRPVSRAGALTVVPAPGGFAIVF
jgi:membrane-associated phospholipid phosphatase